MIKNVRDKLLAHLPRSVRNIERQVVALAQGQEGLKADLGARLSLVERRISNSGFVMLGENEILAKIFSGAKMYLDPRDRGLVPHLLLDGEWEHDITMAWLKTVRPGDTVLDIGANFGYFGVLAAQQANRDCRVVLFEANPELMPYIGKTINVNSFSNCLTAENLAVSDKAGKVTLNVLKDYIASSSVHETEELNKYNQNGEIFEVASKVKVEAIAVDEYCEAHKISEVNLIKMDIEGYEDVAYLGMRKLIKNSPGATMFIEFTKQGYKNPRKFYELMLNDFGYVYLIDEFGEIYRPKNTDYSDLVAKSDLWTMLVFSKKKDLNTR